ncbi:putative IS element transposase [Streptomyces lincolnensis]|uniref:Putative IS element transposase n=1 Tax=Streptomyces lincolnensis TaxID=1915 RepID=A0A1B1MA58_STRLN|nr:RNA-guided endonuclease TnpB family protein [Streptomyces lincolnensis]ANS65394.1 putative IS element transposase [Streptomyces lincolnensis]AXG56398.1 putative IS element transposase [Streptomyces lincolnensis]QMV07156.1 transposase [Streptomyces lincolnensis]
MSRFRMYPTREQAEQMLTHCAHARYVWNLAVEQHAHWRRWRKAAPGFAEQCRQLTEARRENEWLAAGNADVQQQALKDFARAKNARFTSGFGEPTWRKKFRHEGFRVIGTDRVPEHHEDGTAKLNAKTSKQVMSRLVVVQKLNRRWAQVKVPGCGWVRFRLSVRGKGAQLPDAKTFRVTFRNGQWHIAFAVIPESIPAPGTGEVIGIDRGVTVTAALSDGRTLNCPQLTVKERAQVRKHQRRAARAEKGSPEKAAGYAKVANLKAREANRRKDWCEKTSTMLARTCDLIRFEKLNIKNMTRSAKRTVDQPGKNVAQKAGLNRGILAQGWGLLRQRTGHKASGRVEDIPAPYTSVRCSACGWIEKKSRKSQADFACISCGFTCNADTNASINVAAGQGGIPRPRRTAGAGGVTTATSRSSAREPQPTWVGIPLF